jgi:hypothetical protein
MQRQPAKITRPAPGEAPALPSRVQQEPLVPLWHTRRSAPMTRLSAG